jgi:hypothetical protein
MTLRCQAMTLRGLAELPVRSLSGTYAGLDPSISCHGTIALQHKYVGCVSRS